MRVPPTPAPNDAIAQRFSVLEMRPVEPDGTVDSNDIAVISAEYE